MISEFSYLLLFIIASILLLVVFLGIAKLSRPDRPDAVKNDVYESGELPQGDAFVSFNLRFYIVAIIFILFDLELILLFPWSTVFGDAEIVKEFGSTWLWFTGIEMLIFVGILALGLLYVWKKGHLDWIKPNPEEEKFKSPVPDDLYDKINKKYV